ncbi:MAG: hypothetical protein ACWGSQ_08550 [Longimicrobiales bacterium]
MICPRRVSAALVALALLAFPSACDDSGPTGAEDGAMVAIQFLPAPPLSGILASPAVGSLAPTAAGTLELESLYLVVDEFKLEGNEGACTDSNPAPDCAKFESDPHLLALNLAAVEPDEVLQEMAPPGTFTSLKFETKWVGENEDVLAQIAAEGVTDWPSNASMMVTGSFTREGLVESEPFRVFFDAEVKIVLPLDPPLVVDGEDETTWVVSIEVDPYVWFTMDGETVDLPALDFDTTGEVHYLEVKLEDAFSKIEFDG